MRALLTAVLLSLSVSLSATTYYVSNSGNDSYDGKTEATAWKTIAKVNSTWAAGTFAPGDNILFHKGETFFGTIKVMESGVAGNPIVLSAYGNGNKPVISGLTTISSWSSYGSGIYYSKVKCESSTSNLVLVNGKNTPMGRWPNNGWMTYEGNNGSNSLTDNQLTNSPDWDGAELVFRKSWWTLERAAITDHSNTTIAFAATSTWGFTNGYGYYIQNGIKTLDALGEWYYKGDTLFMYFGSANPSNYTIKITSSDYLITSGVNSTSYFNYITLDNLCFDGASAETVHLAIRTNNWKIQNCTFNHAGKNAIDGNQYVHDLTIINNTIKNTNNNAIRSIYKGYNNVIKYNTIDSTGVFMGMMNGDDDGGDAIVLKDQSISTSIMDTVTYNTITNTGHCAVRVQYNGYYVSYNFIERHGMTKNDVGGLYTWSANNITFKNNIILSGYGNSGGCGTTSEFGSPDPYVVGCYGIYLDEKTYNVSLIDNTTAFNRDGGIFVQMDSIVNITGNTSYDNGYYQMALIQRNKTNDFPVRKIVMNNNKFISKQPGRSLFPYMQLCLLTMTYEDHDVDEFGTFDYNIYARPIDQDDVFRTYEHNPYNPWNGTGYDLAGWKTYSGQDAHSTGSLVTVTDTADFHFIYNNTRNYKTFELSATLKDVAGVSYSGKVTLSPFTSKVLLGKATITENNDIPVTVTNAAIENATPSRLDMTYNLALTSVVPAASAFKVLVNSTARTVNSVSVSGTNVQLTLASPVVYGDIITVTYTKPATNYLQTSAGVQAATTAAIPVKNNVNSVLPLYVSSVIENAAPTKLVMTYSLSLTTVTPAPTAFTVMVNSVARTVSSVAVSGTKVTLTLASAVAYGNSVTVAYTKPASNYLQTSTGSQAATITAKAVTNNVSPVAPVSPVYVSSVIEEETPILIEMTYDKTLANIIPAASAFSVKVNSVVRGVKSVTVSGTKVTLSLTSSVAYADYVTVTYTIPGQNALQTTAGGKAAALINIPVTNNRLYQDDKVSQKTLLFSAYPNPATNYVTIYFAQPFTELNIIRFYNMAGVLCLEVHPDPGVNTITIPINLKSGMYLVQLRSGKTIVYAQKLIVKK